MINREYWDIEREEQYWDQSDLFYWMGRRAPAPGTVTGAHALGSQHLVGALI